MRRRRAASSQFARCAAKISAGLPSSRSRERDRARSSSESMMRPRPWSRGIVVPQPVEMGELGADAAEIVPDAAQDRLDLGGRLLRKCGDEIGAADAVLRQPRADACAARAAPTFAMRCRVDQPDRAQQRARPGQPSTRVARAAPQQRSASSSAPRAMPCGLERDDDLAEHLAAFQPREAALEIGERRLRCRSPAVSPFAILARLSRMLRIEAPNEPKMLYCCWNSCIRLNVIDRPRRSSRR